MTVTMLTGLIDNIALLVAMGLLYDMLRPGERLLLLPVQRFLSGVILGGMAIALMLDPWEFAPGVLIDSRTVLYSLSALFFGPLPTCVAAVIGVAFRLYQGGPGEWTGVLLILSSSVIGLAWRFARKPKLTSISALELYAMGLVVQVGYLLCVLTLPGDLPGQVLAKIWLPIMLMFPVGTALVGKLMVGRVLRVAAEEQLRESESHYRNLFEKNHVPMLIVDPTTHDIVDANEVASHFYGWSCDELRAMKISQINTLSHEEVSREIQLASNEQRKHFRFKHRLASGEVRDVDVFSGPIRVHGRMLLYSIVSDVTERLKTDEKLRKTEQQFRDLVDNAPIPIFIEVQGRFAYLNAAAYQVFSATSTSQLFDHPLLDRFAPASRASMQARLDSLTQGRRAVPLAEEVCLKVDGRPFEVEVLAVPCMYVDQQGALVFLRDVSDRKRAEEQRLMMERQIQQTQKLESLGVLAGGIAHDFNNILMAVLGHADLALHELPPMSPARESIREIEKASRRAADLCRQMLAYSGRGNFVIEAIDLRAMIEEMLHLLKTSISKKVLLNLNLEPNLPPMRGDATQIRQIIMNLVINASESIGERSGVVTVSTGARDCDRAYLEKTILGDDLEEGVYLWLEVADTGCGMDADTQSRLFEPFFSTKFTGRGLGMAAVLGIVRGHKGTLTVESQPGKGSCLRIYFPAMAEDLVKHASVPQPPAARPWRGSGTVLLVDDEETIRALTRKMLESFGFSTLVAADGCEALERYRKHKDAIDLVLLDLTMPRMNGEETLMELQRLNPRVRVVLSSGYTQSEIASKFDGKGVLGFIQKPYTAASLRHHLRRALEEETTGCDVSGHD